MCIVYKCFFISTFCFIGPMCPERHIEGAQLLGSEVKNPRKEDAGKITGDIVRKYMDDVRYLCYFSSCITFYLSFRWKFPMALRPCHTQRLTFQPWWRVPFLRYFLNLILNCSLMNFSTLQERVNKLAPRPQTEEDLTALYENSLTVY